VLQSKFVEAEPLLRECLSIRAKETPDAWQYFSAQSELGASLMGQNRYAQAEPLVRSGSDGLKRRDARIDPRSKGRLPEAAGRLVGLYGATGKADEAARWRAEWVELLWAIADPPSAAK
jgi:eukaryotic-like serine/threonine-protein kinase